MPGSPVTKTAAGTLVRANLSASTICDIGWSPVHELSKPRPRVFAEASSKAHRRNELDTRFRSVRTTGVPSAVSPNALADCENVAFQDLC